MEVTKGAHEREQEVVGGRQSRITLSLVLRNQLCT